MSEAVRIVLLSEQECLDKWWSGYAHDSWNQNDPETERERRLARVRKALAQFQADLDTFYLLRPLRGSFYAAHVARHQPILDGKGYLVCGECVTYGQGESFPDAWPCPEFEFARDWQLAPQKDRKPE